MKKVFLFLNIIICLICIQNQAFGITKGNGSVSGFIVDSLTNLPMQYATVSLLSQADSSIISGSITNSDGSFTIDDLPSMNYLCKVSYIGYEKTFIRNIDLKQSNPNIDLGRIVLIPADENKEEILVTSEKDAISYQVDKKVINVSQMLAGKGGNVTDILRQIPSVNVDIEGNVSLRGSGNFQVLIDGKPTLLSATDVFRQIPSDMIESIEIITNPSAKYDPDGTSGIINIIMVKKKRFGYNGMITTSVGTRDKYNAGVQLNIKNGDLGFLIGADYGNNKYHPKSDFIREMYYGTDTVLYAQTKMNRLINPDNHKFKLGADYNFSESDNSSLTFEYGKYDFIRVFPTDMHYWSKPEYENHYAFNYDDMLYGGNLFQTTFNFQHKFEEKDNDLQANLIYANWNGGFKGNTTYYTQEDSMNFPNYYGPAQNRSSLDDKKHQARLSIDYTKRTETDKIELGSLTDVKYSKSYYLYQSLMTDRDIWLTNEGLTNDYDFNFIIQALYATYSSDIFGFDYELGVRLEYYKRQLNQITMDVKYPYEKFSVFPTFHLTRQLAEEQQIQFSYSRRVERPHERLLNPFPDYTDNIYISAGNPNLKPEYTNSFELNYRYGFEQSFFAIETYFRQTEDLITQYQSLRDDGKILLSVVNLNKDYLYGAEFSSSITLYKWFRFNANMNYYSYSLEEKLENRNRTTSKNIFSTNLIATFIITPNTFLQLNGNYNSPTITATGDMDEVYSAGATIKQDFLDKKLSVSLQTQDVFGTARYRFNSFSSGFRTYGEYIPERYVFRLNVTYLINDYRRQVPKSENLELEYQGNF